MTSPGQRHADAPVPLPAALDRRLRALPALGAGAVDLVAEDLATLALDLAQARTAADLVMAAAHAVVGLVPGASQAVLSVLRHDGVELSAATGPGAESSQAWQLALGSGPAVTAAGAPGTVVVVDDLATDPRWPHLQGSTRRDRLPSTLSVAAALPTVMRTVVLSWHGGRRNAFVAPDCARVALLTTAHVAVALDHALREDHLHEALGHLRNISLAAFRTS